MVVLKKGTGKNVRLKQRFRIVTVLKKTNIGGLMLVYFGEDVGTATGFGGVRQGSASDERPPPDRHRRR